MKYVFLLTSKVYDTDAYARFFKKVNLFYNIKTWDLQKPEATNFQAITSDDCKALILFPPINHSIVINDNILTHVIGAGLYKSASIALDKCYAYIQPYNPVNSGVEEEGLMYKVVNLEPMPAPSDYVNYGIMTLKSVSNLDEYFDI